MDVDVIAAQLRAAAFPDRWTECSTWAAGLSTWHNCVHTVTWSPAEGYEDEYAAWIRALIACALHQAAGDEAQPVRSASLARAALLLIDAPTTVAMVDSLPEAPPGELASYLASVAEQMEQGNAEAKDSIVQIIGLAHQILADHAFHGEHLDDRIPALARASRIGLALAADDYHHPAYPDAPSLSQHLALVRELRQSAELAELSGQSLSPAEQRARLLHTAAFTDRWLLAWGPDDQPVERAEQAEALAVALQRHDQEHNSSGTPPGREAERPEPRAYVREQYALWAAARS
ncbi:hypothetical protein OK074_5115 [Actinobacteria bacterium OK074]|nr:hypothetical protein OK074_5115 [Actinobacteria bacterium OK074]